MNRVDYIRTMKELEEKLQREIKKHAKRGIVYMPNHIEKSEWKQDREISLLSEDTRKNRMVWDQFDV